VKASLLDILACPLCGRDLALRAEPSVKGEIVTGILECASCRKTFPIERGVPRLSVGRELTRTSRGFAAQWRLRRNRRFERAGVLYGQDVAALVAWLFQTCLGDADSTLPWMLDAGCGTGEKAIACARQHPDLQVVAMDITDACDVWATASAGAPNVHFVQADVMHPPFKPRSFGRVMSWGVLHHTPNTRTAFERAASLVSDGGRLVVWLYPDPREDALAAAYYRVRDRHFLGIGHKLPNLLRFWLVRLYTMALAPIFLRYFTRVIKPRYRASGYVRLDNLTFFEKYNTMTFILYDNLTPEFQFRHTRDEVKQWFEAQGFGSLQTDGLGHHWGQRVRSAAALNRGDASQAASDSELARAF
jgi:ubiquinone/menaquinone biosynthesis C-methylase UbiE/uncharacterized protein YbaR (Trm112 family)